MRNISGKVLQERWATLLLALSASALCAAEVDFAHQVVPILKEHCAKCHTGDKKKGGLAMNTRAELLKGGENGKIVSPGKSGTSLMFELLHSDDEDEWMPPKGDRVPAEQIAILAKWIDAGLPWEDGFTFGESAWEPPLKPRRVKLPAGQKSRSHPVDRILDSGLAARKQSVPEAMSDAGFLRRAMLDLHGLLPSPDELEAFVEDHSSDKRSVLIDKLLSDDIAYADHWLTMWNDLLRNDYTGTGFITGGRKKVTPWLYAALRENKPYDQFAKELIAPGKGSAGFIDGIKWRGEVNASQSVEIQFAQNISQVFLGINMKCASCHDSFIDRWTLEEAYNLAAIYSDKPMELNRCDKPTGKMAVARWIFPELGDVDASAPKQERLKQLAGLMTHKDNGRFSRTMVNRIWHRLMGRGIVHPVDAMHTQPWNQDLLDYLAVKFSEDGYDLRKLIRHVVTSEAYQSVCVVLEEDPGSDYVYAGPIAKRMTAEQFMDSVRQITGSHPSKMEAKVNRVEARTGDSEEKTIAADSKQVQMEADWIWGYADTAKSAAGEKVVLRRVVTIHNAPEKAFMVLTCDNSYELLINGKRIGSDDDWPTVERYDVSQHIRKGENTITVKGGNGGSSPNAAGLYGQLLVHTVAGIRSVNTDDQWEVQDGGGKWKPAAKLTNQQFLGGRADAAIREKLNPKMSKQMIAATSVRPIRAALVKNDFLMRSLGRPHRDQVVTTRPAELTTLQAIDLSNGETLAQSIANGAKQLAAKGKSPDDVISWLYRYALSREPTADELSVLKTIAGDGKSNLALEDMIWPVLMLPEFQIVR